MDKKAEMIAIDNVLKLLRRGKWELEGDEILAFYRSFEFLVKRMQELQKPDVQVVTTAPIKVPEQPSKKKKK